MDTEEIVIDYRCQGEIVEDVGAVSPDVERAVFSEALVVEAIDLSDLSTLVIASDEGDEIGVSNFVGQ